MTNIKKKYNNMTAFLYIDYCDGDQTTYKGIEICTDNNMLQRFDYGDITIDFIDYLMWASNQEELTSIAYSSSFDHFFKDGEKYKALLIDHSNDNMVANTDNMSFKELNKLSTYPVPININTFDELKNYYRETKLKKD